MSTPRRPRRSIAAVRDIRLWAARQTPPSLWFEQSPKPVERQRLSREEWHHQYFIQNARCAICERRATKYRRLAVNFDGKLVCRSNARCRLPAQLPNTTT